MNHNLNHKPGDNDSRDQRMDALLDTLLASRPLTPRTDFSGAVLRALEDGTNADSLDTLVDARLRHHPLRTHTGRTEKFMAAVLRADHIRKILRWSVPALAASVALFLALPAFLNPSKAPVPENVLVEAMAKDPALAAMLHSYTIATATALPSLDREVVDAVSDLNDNTLAWLETLTRDEIY